MKASLVFAITLFVTGSFSQARVQDSAEKVVTLNTAYGIKQSIGWYLKEYGRIPPGDPVFLISVLQGRDIDGANPRKIVFWEPHSEKRRLWWRVRWGSLNQSGELIDGWGMPFRWIIEADAWKLISAGKNQTHENGKGDDIEIGILTPSRTSAYSESPQAITTAAGASAAPSSGDY